MSGLEELLEATIRSIEKFVEIYKEKPIETLLSYHLTLRSYDAKIDEKTIEFLKNRKRETTDDLIKLFNFMKENGLIISGEILEKTLNHVEEVGREIGGKIDRTKTDILTKMEQGFDGVNKGINDILHKLDTYESYFGKINEELECQKATLELIQTSLPNMPNKEDIDTLFKKMKTELQNLGTSVEKIENELQNVQSVASLIENSVKNIHEYLNIENYENIGDYINKEVIPKFENVEKEVTEIREKVSEIESIINKIDYRIPDNLKETINAYNKTLEEVKASIENIYSLVQNYGKGKEESSNINGISDIGKEYNQKERK